TVSRWAAGSWSTIKARGEPADMAASLEYSGSFTWNRHENLAWRMGESGPTDLSTVGGNAQRVENCCNRQKRHGPPPPIGTAPERSAASATRATLRTGRGSVRCANRKLHSGQRVVPILSCCGPKRAGNATDRSGQTS